jgi:hypothetical protein
VRDQLFDYVRVIMSGRAADAVRACTSGRIITGIIEKVAASLDPETLIITGELEPPIRPKSPFHRTGSSRFRGCPISRDHTDRGDLGFDGHDERLLPVGTCPPPVSRTRRSRREAVTFEIGVAR